MRFEERAGAVAVASAREQALAREFSPDFGRSTRKTSADVGSASRRSPTTEVCGLLLADMSAAEVDKTNFAVVGFCELE